MSTVGPVTEHPFRIIQEGAFFIFEGILTILRGVVCVIRGALTVLAGLFLNIALLFIILCIKFIILIFQITPTSKGLQRINRLLDFLINAISSSTRCRRTNWGNVRLLTTPVETGEKTQLGRFGRRRQAIDGGKYHGGIETQEDKEGDGAGAIRRASG